MTSKINFGAPSSSGSGFLSTPLVDKAPSKHYYVTLKAISVGSQKLPYTNSLRTDYDFADGEEGNMIIDSGTTLTFIGSHFYKKLMSIVEEEIGYQP